MTHKLGTMVASLLPKKPPTILAARFASTCPRCHQRIQVGSTVEWSKGSPARHLECSPTPRNTEKNVSQWIRTEMRGQTNPITVAACKSCGAFCSVEGGSIRHARSCESGLKSELWTPATVAAPVVKTSSTTRHPRTLDNRLPLNTVGNGEAEDKWHAVNSRNPKDWDRAMNRDD